MFVSIIIISRDRHDVLLDTVSALLQQVQKQKLDARTEVIVVEEGDAAQPIPDTRYRHLPRRNYGFGYARNRGLQIASGDIIIFIDDDIMPSEHWLERLLAPFADPNVMAVAGGIVPSPQGLGVVGASLGRLGLPGGGPSRPSRIGRALFGHT